MDLDPRLLLLITSLLGAILGVYILVLVPSGDMIGFSVPFFALMGIIAANLVLLFIHEIVRKVAAKPSRTLSRSGDEALATTKTNNLF